MADTKGNNLTDPDLWIRLLYMVLFGFLTFLARFVVLLLAGVQFLLALFTGRPNHNLRILGDGIAQWTQQAYQFLTFADEQKPYPFRDWPQSRLQPASESTPSTGVDRSESAPTSESGPTPGEGSDRTG